MSNLGGKLNITEAERKRRSDLAIELNKKRDPVTGKRVFGGKQANGGRPRKKRATEIMNEKVEQHAEEVFNRLLFILRKGKPLESLQAANQMVAISNKETDIQTREEKSIENTTTEDLMELVASRLARLAERGAINLDFEGEAEEVEQLTITRGTEDVGAEDADQPEDEPERYSGSGSADSGFGTSAFARRTTDE